MFTKYSQRKYTKGFFEVRQERVGFKVHISAKNEEFLQLTTAILQFVTIPFEGVHLNRILAPYKSIK